MEEHAAIGHDMLVGSKLDLLDLAATIAWTHHERVDGTGYPRGLRGWEVPLEVSVIAVAVTAHLRVGDIAESLLVHPALAEALAEAAE